MFHVLFVGFRYSRDTRLGQRGKRQGGKRRERREGEGGRKGREEGGGEKEGKKECKKVS